MRMKAIFALAVASPLLAASAAHANHEADLPVLMPWTQDYGQPVGERRQSKATAPKATAEAHRRDGAHGKDTGQSHRHAPDFADYD